MIIKLAKDLRIKTEPLNWTILKLRDGKWVEDGHFDNLRQALRSAAVMRDFETLASICDELGLKGERELSAYYLTKKLKHPAFRRKMSANSLKNLKPNNNLSS